MLIYAYFSFFRKIKEFSLGAPREVFGRGSAMELPQDTLQIEAMRREAVSRWFSPTNRG